MTENILRVGRITSSNIHKIMTTGKGIHGFGAPAITYISELNLERRMQVSLKQEVYSRPMAWGKLIEMWVFKDDNYLDTSFQSCGDKTLSHPTCEFWAGSPDYKSTSKSIIAECKGYERKNFAAYADAIATGDTEIIKRDCPEEYWQMVSNAIILGFTKVQPVLFMPYKSELADIRLFAGDVDVDNPFMFKWISDSMDAQLPYLVDGGYYNNFNSCILEVPQKDIDFLTERVMLAGTLLKPFHKITE